MSNPQTTANCPYCGADISDGQLHSCKSNKSETTPLQEAANRIRAGIGTKEDERLIDREFQRVKWQRIRELKRQTRSRDRLWT